MPLHVPPAPAPALHSVLAALKSPTARELRTPGMGGPRHQPGSAQPIPGQPTPVQTGLTPDHPHPVHTLDPRTAPHRALPEARRTGWRFLIRSADGDIVAAAQTAHTAHGWTFSHFSEGPFVTSTHRALAQAHSLPGLYTPRLLSVPALYMLALWLHTDTSPDCTDDLLIPLAPAPLGIAAHRTHPIPDLLPVLTHRLGPTAAAPLLSSSA